MLTGVLLAVSLGAPPEATGDIVPRSEAHKDAVARYGAALWNARRDRLLSAVQGFEESARQDPAATAPKKELVRLYAQLGREREAIRLGREVIENDPHDIDTAHLLARLLFEAGEVKEAIVVAQRATRSPTRFDRPDKALAIYRDLATLCDKAGDPAAAADALRCAIALFTEHRQQVLASGLYTPREIDAEVAETQERLGKMLVKQAKYDDAAMAYRAAYELYADPKRAHDPYSAARLDWNLSGVAAARNDPVAAITHLERFLKLKPRFVEPYERYATQLKLAGRAAQVIPRLQALVADDPDNLPALSVLTMELASDPASRADAEHYFTRLGESTNDPAILRVVLRSRIATGQARKILDDLDAAFSATSDDKLGPMRQAFAAAKARTIGDVLRSEPEWASAVFRAATVDLRQGTRHRQATWHLLGHLAVRHRQLDVAAHHFREAIRNAPQETEMDAYVGLIDVLRRLRRHLDIVTVCREGLHVARWVPPVYFNFHLSLALAELGDADAAIAAVDKAILQSGDGARLDTQLRKLWVLETLGRDDEAIALGKKLLDEYRTVAERIRIRYSLAGAYHSAGKLAEWEAELRAILDIDPDHAGACNNLGYHLADQGRNLDEAEQLIRHAIALDHWERRRTGDPEPVSASYLDSLGWVRFRKGRLAEARQLIEQAAAQPEGSVSGEIWDHLGDVCFRLGDSAAAKSAWDKALVRYATEARARRQGRPEDVKRKLMLIK